MPTLTNPQSGIPLRFARLRMIKFERTHGNIHRESPSYDVHEPTLLHERIIIQGSQLKMSNTIFCDYVFSSQAHTVDSTTLDSSPLGCLSSETCPPRGRAPAHLPHRDRTNWGHWRRSARTWRAARAWFPGRPATGRPRSAIIMTSSSSSCTKPRHSKMTYMAFFVIENIITSCEAYSRRRSRVSAVLAIRNHHSTRRQLQCNKFRII